jgi:hypothetical protein
MRILIQDPESKRFFDGQVWGQDATSAMEFESVYSAEEFCRNHAIQVALIVVRFNNAASQDIKYAVGPANALLASKPPTTRLYRPTGR